jgi:hypothetical protein
MKLLIYCYYSIFHISVSGFLFNAKWENNLLNYTRGISSAIILFMQTEQYQMFYLH